MLAWRRDRGTGSTPGQTPTEQPDPVTTVADEENKARLAEAACKTELTVLRCKLERERLEQEAEERAEEPKRRRREADEAREQAKAERAAREATVKAWRDEQAEARKERREARKRFWSSLGDYWRKRQESLLGQSGTLRVLMALGLPAVLALVIYAVAQDADTWKILGIGLLAATAAFTVGALLGFLFGIPRSVAVKKDDDKEATAEAKNGEAVASAAERFAPNTNLEEISDWLTKILVGVGLVQVHQISGAVEDLANGLASGLGSQGFAVAVTLLVAFSITGFVSAYLYTRLRLQSAFERATTIQQAVEAKARAETDARALVQKQLSPGEIDRPPLAELTAALKAATPGIRSSAFYSARDQRRKNWQGRPEAGEDKDYVAPTIGVFQALIACDEEGHYHRTRAELGYALKDQAPPDFAGAKAALDEAIRLSPKDDVPLSRIYEFNRAYCKIKLDPNADGEATRELARSIVDDLSAALDSTNAQKIAEREIKGEGVDELKSVQKWVERNGALPEVKALKEKLRK